MEKHLTNFYKTKSGDTIESIAKKYGISSLQILLFNPVLPEKLKEGLFLYINR